MKQNLIRIIATSALLIGSITPVFAGNFGGFDNFSRFRNGDDRHSDQVTNRVDLTNTADIVSNIHTNSNTGNNVQTNNATVNAGSDHVIVPTLERDSHDCRIVKDSLGFSVFGYQDHNQYGKDHNSDWYHACDRNRDNNHEHQNTPDPINVQGTNELSTGFADALTNNTIKANTASGFDFSFPSFQTTVRSRHSDPGFRINVTNDAVIDSTIHTNANTGNNTQTNNALVNGSEEGGNVTVSGYNTMYTGDASSTTNSTIVVNSVWTP